MTAGRDVRLLLMIFPRCLRRPRAGRLTLDDHQSREDDHHACIYLGFCNTPGSAEQAEGESAHVRAPRAGNGRLEHTADPAAIFQRRFDAQRAVAGSRLADDRSTSRAALTRNFRVVRCFGVRKRSPKFRVARNVRVICRRDGAKDCVCYSRDLWHVRDAGVHRYLPASDSAAARGASNFRPNLRDAPRLLSCHDVVTPRGATSVAYVPATARITTSATIAARMPP